MAVCRRIKNQLMFNLAKIDAVDANATAGENVHLKES